MSKADQLRDERLAAALRQNLRRRKSQGRVTGSDAQAKDENQDTDE